ncbi:MAG: hypothetical protein IPI10_19160 [Bacteroidetes bacterium]|nr:hypothetical protein [Bacteroidota bacterium]
MVLIRPHHRDQTFLSVTGIATWTTGDASGGTGGFIGTPATVGVNNGNGIDYIQIGNV